MSGGASSSGLLAALRGILSEQDCLTGEATQRYLVDHRGLYHGAALAVARPRTVEAISRLLAFCSEKRIGVVPQGGNTSYCGVRRRMNRARSSCFRSSD